MATRLYISDATPDISPSIAGGWEQNTGGFVTKSLSTSTGAGSAITTEAPTLTSGTWTQYDDCILLQMIYGPIGAGEISGTVQGSFQVIESSGSDNLRMQQSIRVIGSDGSTVRGTLVDFNTETGTVNPTEEFSTIRRSRTYPWNTASTARTVSNVTAENGDYVVCELGFRPHVAVRTLTGTVWYGNESGNVDLTLAINDAGTNDRPWIEFSHNFAAYEEGDTTITAPVAGSTGRAPAPGLLATYGVSAARGDGKAVAPAVTMALTAPVPVASGMAPAPGVAVSYAVAASVADGNAPAPNVTSAFTITAPPGLADGIAPVPGLAVDLSAPVAISDGVAPLPGLTMLWPVSPGLSDGYAPAPTPAAAYPVSPGLSDGYGVAPTITTESDVVITAPAAGSNGRASAPVTLIVYPVASALATGYADAPMVGLREEETPLVRLIRMVIKNRLLHRSAEPGSGALGGTRPRG